MPPLPTPDDAKKDAAKAELPAKEIRSQLKRIFTSPEFKASKAQRALLRFAVEKTLAGKADEVKGYTVATQVFGRKKNFDQATNPIVSIQARKLRKALENYYQIAGRQDPVRIDIPKGTYVPVFTRGFQSKTGAANLDGRHAVADEEAGWPAILIRPFSNLSDDRELDFWGIGLALEIADELARYPDMRVMTLNWSQNESRDYPSIARFELDGSVRSDGSQVKISVHLGDTRTGRQIWSDSRRSPVEAAKLIAFQEEVARTVAVKIAGERGYIAKTLIAGLKYLQTDKMEVYEATLRYYAYGFDGAPENFTQAMAALKTAVAIAPECGQVWTMLARFYSEIYAFELPGVEDPLETAYQHALRGVSLAPDDQRARVILAFVHLFRNDLTAGLMELDQAIKLSPETLFMLDGIGYLKTLMGNWDEGVALIEKIIRLNPFYGNFVHYALWLNCLRQQAYAEAYLETLKINRPASMWHSLVRASTLGLLGQTEDARKEVSLLLSLKPDFPQRGRELIRHFIKFEALVDRTVEGLAKAGVNLK